MTWVLGVFGRWRLLHFFTTTIIISMKTFSKTLMIFFALAMLLAVARNFYGNLYRVEDIPKPILVSGNIGMAEIVAEAERISNETNEMPTVEWCDLDSTRVCINLWRENVGVTGFRVEGGQRYEQAVAEVNRILDNMEAVIKPLNAEIEKRVGEPVGLFLDCSHHAFGHHGYARKFSISLDDYGDNRSNPCYTFGYITGPDMAVLAEAAKRLPWEKMRHDEDFD